MHRGIALRQWRFRTGIWAVVGLVVAGLFAGCAPSPPPAVSADISTSPSAGQILGLELGNNPLDETRLALVIQSGTDWVRLPLRWRVLEPKRQVPPEYRWERYDSRIQQLSEAGLRVILTLRDNPMWASGTRCGPLNDKGERGLAEVLDAMTRRYSAAPYYVHHWEIYNEPDNRAEEYGSQGGCWGDASAAYARTLEIAYHAIHTADPNAVVILGGLALEKLDDDLFNVHFLEDVLAAGGGANFDWMNFHYYPAFDYRWKQFGRGLEGKASYVRKVMDEAGVDKPLMCSELGQPSAGPVNEGYSDEETMAQMVKGFARGAAADLKVIVWHKLEDRVTDQRLYGLLTPDAEPKPAYTTFQMLARELDNARFVRKMGHEEMGDDAIEAYRFSLDERGGYHVLLVAWREGDGDAVVMSVPAEQVAIIDIADRETQIIDGGTSDLSGDAGVLGIEISSRPVLIRY